MASPKRIPDGMHVVTPHLVCAGAAEAIEFYQKAFGAREETRLPGPDGKLMHALIRIEFGELFQNGNSFTGSHADETEFRGGESPDARVAVIEACREIGNQFAGGQVQSNETFQSTQPDGRVGSERRVRQAAKSRSVSVPEEVALLRTA